MLKVVVFGLGRFGASVATSLYEQGAEVLAIDRALRLVEDVKDQVSVAIACDATQRASLEAYDISHMDVAVVGIGTNFEASVLVTMNCRELKVPRIIAKALNPMQAQVLRSVGAHRVIMPEEEMGERLANHLLHGSVVDFVELPDGFSLRRIPIPADWAGKKLADLKLLGDRRLNLIQIVRPQRKLSDPADQESDVLKIPLPHGETALEAGDFIDVIGPDTALRKYL